MQVKNKKYIKELGDAAKKLQDAIDKIYRAGKVKNKHFGD